MDEPTNHLDIQSKEAVARMIRSFPGSILLVSHDRDFLEQTCTSMWYFSDTKMIITSDMQSGYKNIQS